MNLKKKIKQYGWTMERLGAEMTNNTGGKGITQQSMSSIINGNPSVSKLQEIAKIIGISVSELVSDSDGLTALIQQGDNFYRADSIEELESIVYKIKEHK